MVTSKKFELIILHCTIS